MRLTGKFLTMAGLLSVAGAAGLGFATPAFADTVTYPIQYHNTPSNTTNGSATVIRSGNSVEIEITLNSGSAFSGAASDLQICASTVAFTTKVNPSDCTGTTTNGQLFQFTESGSSADPTITLGPAFTGVGAYLQIHLNTVDNGVANTSEVNPPNSDVPIYGNVPTDPLPVEAIGAVGLAGAMGGLLFLMQRRRRGVNATA